MKSVKPKMFIMSEYDVKLAGNPDDLHDVLLLISIGSRYVALQADAGLARSLSSPRIQGKSAPILEAHPMDEMKWWGRSGLAHYVSVLSTMRTACGRTFLQNGKDFTRFKQETGEPWPRCARCVAALAKANGATR